MSLRERNRKYLEQEESLAPEYKELISSLPKQNGWVASHLYQYEGFWHAAAHLQGAISCRKHFQPRHSDVLLVTTPKSGTTWLKALLFSLINRNCNPISGADHPLLSHNPHDLVPFLEIKLYARGLNPDLASLPSPRLFATHMPYVSLPESLKSTSSQCKIVYLCRNPKDTFVSLWHFTNKLRTPEMGPNQIGEVFDRFCNGISLCGPFWDHVVEYWKLSKERPHRAFFLNFEEIKARPAANLRRLAEFLNCPFSAEEEELGLVEQILEFCSFDHLSCLGVNNKGVLSSGEENNSFFRRGEVGDWKNYLSQEMAGKIDRISQEKFGGLGLELL